jgi:hypothetical protein
MPRLYKTVVESRNTVSQALGGDYWVVVRSYLVVADDVDQADRMTPCFEGEFVKAVYPQDKSPYVYLLEGVE